MRSSNLSKGKTFLVLIKEIVHQVLLLFLVCSSKSPTRRPWPEWQLTGHAIKLVVSLLTSSWKNFKWNQIWAILRTTTIDLFTHIHDKWFARWFARGLHPLAKLRGYHTSQFRHHPLTSSAVIVWIVVGLDLFLNIISIDFTAGIRLKCWCDWARVIEVYISSFQIDLQAWLFCPITNASIFVDGSSTSGGYLSCISDYRIRTLSLPSSSLKSMWMSTLRIAHT